MRPAPVMRRPLAAVAVLALLGLCGACGASGGSSAPTVPAGPERPQPAGAVPSHLATMVCQPKAQHDIAEVLGVRAHVGPDTWVAHRYSCPYRYDEGSFTLSIKELSSWPQTLAYYHALGQTLGNARPLGNLGQGAFQTTDGSVVVRKDWKVLLVDIADLPAQFGSPPTAASDVAVTVADLILECWAGD